MIIETRKCDICGKRYDSDGPGFYRFSVLKDFNAAQIEACLECMAPLYDKAAETRRTAGQGS